MNKRYRTLFLLLFVSLFLNVSADYFIDFKPNVSFRKSETPGFMNAYCDTSAIVLYQIHDEVDTVHIDFYLDKDFPATDDAEFNKNLLGIIDSSFLSSKSFIVYDELDLDFYETYDNHIVLADSIVAKVTSNNDSTLSMRVEEYNSRDSDWRTGRFDLINFNKKTKSRYYKDLADSISMWSLRGYDGEDYTISDHLITVYHYTPDGTGRTSIGYDKHTKTTIVDREKWESIPFDEIILNDGSVYGSFLGILATLQLAEGWGCSWGDTTKGKRFDVSECYNGDIDMEDSHIGAYEEGITFYLPRCPGYRWYEAPVFFTYDEIYDFLLPGTAVYKAAQDYCKTHKPTEFDKEYNQDSTEVESVGIDFDVDYIQIDEYDVGGEYSIAFPQVLQKSKKLSKTWCWVDPRYHNHNSNETIQRGKDVKIPRKIKYEGFRKISDNGNAEMSVRIFTNLVEDYPELIPTLTGSPDCTSPDFHEYDLPGEKLSKQYIYRCIDEDTKYLIEYDIRCLPERAFYYEVASYMMFNCFQLEDYNQHYYFK